MIVIILHDFELFGFTVQISLLLLNSNPFILILIV